MAYLFAKQQLSERTCEFQLPRSGHITLGPSVFILKLRFLRVFSLYIAIKSLKHAAAVEREIRTWLRRARSQLLLPFSLFPLALVRHKYVGVIPVCLSAVATCFKRSNAIQAKT